MKRCFSLTTLVIFPRYQWTGDLIGPRGAGGDFWLYNPGTQPLTVTARTLTPTSTLTSTTTPGNGTPGTSPLPGATLTPTQGTPALPIASLPETGLECVS